MHASIKILSGNHVIDDTARFGIVCSRFNAFIVEQLQAGCIDSLLSHGASADRLTVVKVPGAFELSLTARLMADSGDYDAVIVLGAVIRGATPHFDYVAGECAKGVAAAGVDSKVPVIFGVLTTDTIEQAIERAGTKAGNKGCDAALSAIEMVTLLRQLG